MGLIRNRIEARRYIVFQFLDRQNSARSISSTTDAEQSSAKKKYDLTKYRALYDSSSVTIRVGSNRLSMNRTRKNY